MHLETRMLRQPCLDLLGLVGPVVIANYVHIEIGPGSSGAEVKRLCPAIALRVSNRPIATVSTRSLSMILMVRHEFNLGYAQGYVDACLSLYAEGLKGDGVIGAANQKICATAHADRGISGNTGVPAH